MDAMTDQDKNTKDDEQLHLAAVCERLQWTPIKSTAHTIGYTNLNDKVKVEPLDSLN